MATASKKAPEGAVKKAPTPTMYVPRRELEIPAEIKKYCEENKLVLRWINAVVFTKNSGYHKDYWVPFNYKEAGLEKALGFTLGAQADGFIRRGDTILGVRAKEIEDAWKADLKRKNARYNAAVADKTTAEQLKSVLKQSGIKGRVISGYDDE